MQKDKNSTKIRVYCELSQEKVLYMIEQIETVYDDVFVVESAKDDRYFIVDQHKNMIVVENVQHLSSFENGFARATTRDNQTLFLDTSGSIADKDQVRAVLRLQQKFSNPKKENLPKSLMSDESYKVYRETDFFTDQVHQVDVEDVVTVKIEYEDFFDVSTLELKVIYRDIMMTLSFWSVLCQSLTKQGDSTLQIIDNLCFVFRFFYLLETEALNWHSHKLFDASDVVFGNFAKHNPSVCLCPVTYSFTVF